MSEGPTLRQLEIVWMAMVGGLLAYTLLMYALIGTGIVSLEPMFGADVMNIVGAAVMVWLVSAVFLRRRMVAGIPDDLPPETRLQRYGGVCIIALALMEGAGLFLITFAIVTNSATWALAGGGAATVLMFLARPSKDEAGL